MTTVAQLRKAALALPETEEGTHFGMVAFSVRGRGFASVDGAGWVRWQLPDADVDAALVAHPAGDRLVRRGTPIGFRVPLTEIDGKDLNALTRAAWRWRAPKRLSAALIAAESEPPGGDLPAAIGRPATQALRGAGISTVDEVAKRTERELLALHGVGPRAVRILADVLARQGRSLAR